MAKYGDKNICNGCEKEIEFNGQYWVHVNGKTYRHIVRPRFEDPVEPIMPDQEFHKRCAKILSKLHDCEKQYRETPKFKQILRSDLFGKINAYRDCYNIMKRR